MSDSPSGGHYEKLEARVLRLMEQNSVTEQEFNECALAIFAFQSRFNQPYANFVRHLRIETPHDWRAIPAVPLGAFRNFDLRAFAQSETVATFHTSGTTGEGFGRHHFRSLRLYESSILRCWDRMRLPALPQFVLTPPPARAPHSSLSHMMGVLKARARNGRQHFCIDEDGRLDTTALERQVGNRQPLLLLATALAYLHFFDELQRRHTRLQLPAGSAAFETGGYKGSARALEKRELYALFDELLGLPPDDIINEYSMTELSSQFYSRGLDSIHRGPPWTRAIVIETETQRTAREGRTGSMRIFDLANIGSVLAIQTQDLAIQRADGFELIGRDPKASARGCSRAADEFLSHPA
jgi:hypothetical protein